MPGRGNLFEPIDNVLPTDDDDEVDDGNVFRVRPKNRMTRAPSVPRMPKTKSAAASKARLAGLGPTPTSASDENAAAPSQSPRRRVSADNTTHSPLRRVPSLRAS